MLEKSTEKGKVVLLKPILPGSPLGRFVGQPGARLNRGALQRDLHLCRQWIDMIAPRTDKVIPVRIQGWNRFRPQFKRAPPGSDTVVQGHEFLDGGLRQPAERSKIV
jgi:hypothetical protein